MAIGYRTRLSLGDRNQRQAQIVYLLQQAMQRRLVSDRAGKDGIVVLVIGDSQVVKPLLPMLIQATFEPDLVPLGFPQPGLSRVSIHVTSSR